MSITTTTPRVDDDAERAEVMQFAGCWEALQQIEPHWTAGPDRDGHTRRMIQHVSRRTR